MIPATKKIYHLYVCQPHYKKNYHDYQLHRLCHLLSSLNKNFANFLTVTFFLVISILPNDIASFRFPPKTFLNGKLSLTYSCVKLIYFEGIFRTLPNAYDRTFLQKYLTIFLTIYA